MHGKPLITTACIAFRADERLAHQHGHAVCQPPVPLTRLLRMTLVVSPSAIGPHAPSSRANPDALRRSSRLDTRQTPSRPATEPRSGRHGKRLDFLVPLTSKTGFGFEIWGRFSCMGGTAPRVFAGRRLAN